MALTNMDKSRPNLVSKRERTIERERREERRRRRRGRGREEEEEKKRGHDQKGMELPLGMDSIMDHMDFV